MKNLAKAAFFVYLVSFRLFSIFSLTLFVFIAGLIGGLTKDSRAAKYSNGNKLLPVLSVFAPQEALAEISEGGGGGADSGTCDGATGGSSGDSGSDSSCDGVGGTS